MRKIDAFAHILPTRYLERLERHLERAISSRQLRYYQEGVFRFDSALTDLEQRWRRIDSIGDYSQVLVLAVPPIEEVGPPAIAAEFARLANDEMAELVRKHPDRFVGFACALPLNDTEASLREIDRAVGDLGALGAQVFTNVQGVPLDRPVFDPIFARLERLNRAIWLHPTRNATWHDYPTETESNFGLWWSIGWPYETAAALSRLVYSGSMERHPNLKLIAHHGAGMIPHFFSSACYGPGLSPDQGHSAEATAGVFQTLLRRYRIVRCAARRAVCPGFLRSRPCLIWDGHAARAAGSCRSDDRGHRRLRFIRA